MPYVQIWLAVDPAQQDVPNPLGSDQPIKHPCAPPLADDATFSNALGAQNVQTTTPVFFVEDPLIWTLLLARAKREMRTVSAVVSEAVLAHLAPSAQP